MEISYILLAAMFYAVAPHIYESFLSLFFTWQYSRLVKYHSKKEDNVTPKQR